ncbi:unnamed protein product [Rhizophagus irregularis]|nr:unnamed protein product [Rhizophagus irregularis]
MEKFSISNKSDNELFDLIYSSEQEEENTPDANANIDAQNRNLPISDDEDSETNSEDELVRNSIVEPRLSRISLRGARGRGQGRGRGSGVRRTNADSRFRNRRLIEAPVNTAKLLEKVEAACYLSMKEYWNVPTLTGMIATILDPRLKKLKFVNNSVIKNETIEKLRRLYSNEKFENELNAITTGRSGSASNVHQATNTSSSSNSILSALFDDDDDVEQDIDEVDDYLNLSVQKQSCDPLMWWSDHSKRFPLLSRIARKYLSIPATSVPSERLFSDAGLHLTARRNCLAPELVEQLLFLKRNIALFPIFPPSD